MTVAVIKAITRRIRLRYGSTELAAQACGVPKSVWSGYENADHPDKTIPIGRLLAVAEADERRAVAALFLDDGDGHERSMEGVWVSRQPSS